MKKFDKQRAIELEERVFELAEVLDSKTKDRKQAKKEFKEAWKEYYEHMGTHPFYRTFKWAMFAFYVIPVVIFGYAWVREIIQTDPRINRGYIRDIEDIKSIETGDLIRIEFIPGKSDWVRVTNIETINGENHFRGEVIYGPDKGEIYPFPESSIHRFSSIVPREVVR